MKIAMLAAAAAMATASSADAATYIISMTAGAHTGAGTITIADALIGPNAVVHSADAIVDILFAGSSYSIPYSPTTETFIFDSLGLNIVGVDDIGGSFVEFGRTDGTTSFLVFNDGPVPGTFRTLLFPGGDEQGTFSITRQSGAVPEPSTWAMMIVGFGFVGGAMRAARRRQRTRISYA
jgi:hypothetical protein